MYQLVTPLLQPYPLLLLSLLGVLFIAWRRQRPRYWFHHLALGIAGLLTLISMPAVGMLAERSLEWSYYPLPKDVPSPTDTIVVLSANMHLDDRFGKKFRLGDESLNRCWHALQLYRKAGHCRIIVSGGNVDSPQEPQTLAQLMRDFFVEVGVPASDVILENKSQTTYENARNTSALLQPADSQRVFLVTSATHMLRAQRCFARQGLSVVPAPSNYHSQRLGFLPGHFLPTTGGISRVQTVIHEWLGLGWYWLRGRI
jgi:uncharacterized SAM-binding protein YcdF (DUF218 family)